ncbi:terminase small subunit [Nitratireductor aquimarinus]|uniref:terminase small subunit n=1 Tax=Alphaproteobacteria TaxID=28211 RepID=UPI0019D35EBE|nr:MULTISPECIES: terminase small subunit [Alphaproteobacteria]MBN7759491.1 terminase small subunit [Nitratireductor aquimarinus]MBY6001780.1 terminase small subunit [Tritonibacter mobilis]MBY6024066.1 terminase small subunit [Nitratireductor sp. DP7N14-4]
MPTLPNPRHEAFAQGLAKGLSADEAYQKAGYSPNRGNATRLKANESIRARVDEITEVVSGRVVDKLTITKERVASELAKVAFADLRRAVKWGPSHHTKEMIDGTLVVSSGVTLVDSEELDSDTAAAVSEVANTRDGVKIKMHDKRVRTAVEN